MKVGLLIVALAVVLVSSSVSASAVVAPPREELPFDFFIFRSLWPGTCLAGNDAPSDQVKNFTIHGLWASVNDSGATQPSQCTDEAFDESQIEDLVPTMNIVWASLWPDSGTNSAFWEHEWGKHGTCASKLSSLSTQYDFFSNVLNIKFHTELLSMLEAKGIYPSNSKTYSVSQIQDALSAAGYDGMIYCQPAPHENELGMTNPQLLSIELCLNYDLEHYECNESYHEQAVKQGGCDNSAVWIPTINYK